MSDPIVPRSFTPSLPLDIPRHWLPGNPVISSILNAYTVLVPANEAFYIRTLKRCMPRIHDQALRETVVDFMASPTNVTGAIWTRKATGSGASKRRWKCSLSARSNAPRRSRSAYRW
jgi:predicted metal-dependent hydrolase